jgi:uncharacterized OB-fold protein
MIDAASRPDDLLRTIDLDGKSVAAGDNRAVLADFMPDLIGQLVASADLPSRLKGSEVRSVTDVSGGRCDAVIRYTAPDDTWTELRSRWTRLADGTRRVFIVRNIPDTAPWIEHTGPSDDGLDAPHWEGLRGGELVLQRCREYATWTWSPRPIWAACHSFDMGWEAVEPAETVHSWTRTWEPFTPESSGHLPYVNVVVELPAAGNRRVVGVLNGADGITPRVGASVRGTIEQPPDDRYWPLVRCKIAEERV